MKILKHILVTFAIVVGLTLSVAAQKDDKNRPIKKPPVVNPNPDKPPRGNPPKGDDRPKKPEFYFAAFNRED